MTANVIPNRLKLELEPSIGNHNEDFLAKWNDKLKKFSRELTTDVIEFCGKAITETDAEIEDTNKELKGQTNQEQHNEITATLNENQHTQKKQYKKTKTKNITTWSTTLEINHTDHKPTGLLMKMETTINTTNVTTNTYIAITKINRTITSTNKVTTVTNRAITKINDPMLLLPVEI